MRLNNERGTRRGVARVWAISSLFLLLACDLQISRAAEKERKVVQIKVRDIDPAEAAKVSYARQIKPIVVDSCLECHSTEDHKGGFDATSVANLIKGGKKAAPAIVSGKPDESALVEYLRGWREPQMPKGNPVLSEDELHLVRMWIFAGAKDDSEAVAAEQKASANNLAAFDPKAMSAFGSDPALQKMLNVVLFSPNNEERLFAQRALRLTLLPKPPEPPKVEAPVFNPIDQFIVGRWAQAGLPEAQNPPPVCGDAAFLRRVYLDVIGVIPTAAEAKKFLEDRSADKRTRLTDELLARSEDYAAHWTPFWEEAIGSANVDKVGGIASRGNHRDWIFKSFADNKPFDLMVAELIDPTLPGYRKPIISEANGKRVVAAYIRNETHLDTIQSAAAVGQVFLGTGMKCASCHSHFLNKEWPQARFLAFAGLFAPKDLELIRCEKPSGQTIAAKFPFELPGAPEAAPEELDQRLHRAAQLLIDPANPRFAKTIVNRLWKRYLGLGLFEPQDDFRLDQPPSHPELLAWLADDFMRHGYDLKHTIRLILTSRTYQLAYDPALEDHFDVNKAGQARYYRSPALRRLTAEQLVDSIAAITRQKLEPRNRLYRENASTALTRALGRPSSRNEISTARSDDVAVVQALELLNGDEFYQRVNAGILLDEAATESNFAAAMERLYLSALSRPASAKEIQTGADFLKTGVSQDASGKEQTVEEILVKAEAVTARRDDPVTPDAAPARAKKAAARRPRQHVTIGTDKPLQIGAEDVLFADVQLDPKNPPSEIMVQMNRGETEHQVFWGERTKNSPSHRLGPLPKAGQKARLEVSARDLGIYTAGRTVIGWYSVGKKDGNVSWGDAGIIRRANNPNREGLGDVLWALFACPEFQYVR